MRSPPTTRQGNNAYRTPSNGGAVNRFLVGSIRTFSTSTERRDRSSNSASVHFLATDTLSDLIQRGRTERTEMMLSPTSKLEGRTTHAEYDPHLRMRQIEKEP
jgi:hypothetical protein